MGASLLAFQKLLTRYALRQWVSLRRLQRLLHQAWHGELEPSEYPIEGCFEHRKQKEWAMRWSSAGYVPPGHLGRRLKLKTSTMRVPYARQDRRVRCLCGVPRVCRVYPLCLIRGAVLVAGARGRRPVLACWQLTSKLTSLPRPTSAQARLDQTRLTRNAVGFKSACPARRSSICPRACSCQPSIPIPPEHGRPPPRPLAAATADISVRIGGFSPAWHHAV